MISKQIHRKKLAWGCWSLVVTLMISIYLMILWYPISNPLSHFETLLSGGSIPLAVTIANIYLFIAYFRKGRANYIRLITVIILTVLLCMETTTRAFEIERINWEFEGVITKKYRSTDHLAYSIEVKGNDLEQYEYIDESFYNLVNEGDYIRKDHFSIYAQLNGEKHLFVRGYLLKKIRGRLLKE